MKPIWPPFPSLVRISSGASRVRNNSPQASEIFPIQVDTKFVDARIDFSDRLRRIGVEQNAALKSNPGNLRDRLNGANLIVGVQYGNEYCMGRDGSSDVIGGNSAESIHGQVRNCSPQPL